MAEYLWHGADPAPQDDSGTYELGSRISVLSPVTVRRLRVWNPGQSTVLNRLGRVWDDVSGATIVGIPMPATLQSGWNLIDLPQPLVLQAGKTVIVSYAVAALVGAPGYGYIPDVAVFDTPDGLLRYEGSRFTTDAGAKPSNPTSGYYGIDIEYDAGDYTQAVGTPVITATIKTTGSDVTLTYSADIDAAFAIDWGDGSTSAGPGPKTHTYAHGGNYSVLLTATSASGKTAAKAFGANPIEPSGPLAYHFNVAPDGNNLFADLLSQYLDDADLLDGNIGSRTPAAGLTGRLPFVRVNNWDDENDRLNLRPVFDLDVFADTYAKASALARKIEAILIGYPFRVSSDGRSVLVDRVEVLTSCREVEWQQDSTIRRFQGTYQISIRR